MKRRCIYAVVVLCLLLAGITAGIAYRFTHAGSLLETTTLYFPEGTGFREIVDQLYVARVIPDPVSFAVPVILQNKYRRFKPGEYEFPAGITPRAVMRMMAEGKVVVHKITIAEGLTVREIIEKINAEPLLEGEVVTVPAEGSLLPQTYHFQRADSRQSIIARMQAGMRDTVQQIWETRQPDLPIATPEEAVTLASIIEKETRIASERTHVAAVYLNRLRQGMKLQADPTTQYAIELEEGKPLTRGLRRGDLLRDLPHNTYVYAGLPPTPIANPGRAALEAAVNPLPSEDLFFVATGNGGHYFARTYAEHMANIAKFRAVLAAPTVAKDAE